MLYKSFGVVLVLIFAYLLGSFIQDQLGLSFNSESLKSLQNWIETYERSASIIFFLLVTFRIFIGLSSHSVLIIGGLIFGLIGGTILGALGLLASALIQFYIAKIFGAEWMRSKLQGSLNSIEERIRVYGAVPVFLITAHPIGPQTPINLAGGLKDSADKEKIFVILPDGRSSLVKKSLFSSNNILIPGSTIVVSRDPRPFDAINLTSIITPILADLATSAAAIAAISD